MPSYLQLNCQRTFIRLGSLTDSNYSDESELKLRVIATRAQKYRNCDHHQLHIPNRQTPIGRSIDGISSPRSDSRFYSHFDYGQQVQHSNSKERQKLGNEACRIHPLSVPSQTLVCDRRGSIRRDPKRSRGIRAFSEILLKTTYPRPERGQACETVCLMAHRRAKYLTQRR